MTILVIHNVATVDDLKSTYDRIGPLDFGLDLGCWLEDNKMMLQFIDLEAESNLRLQEHCGKLGLTIELIQQD